MSIIRFRRVACAAALVLTALAARADACSCVAPGPPCQAYWNTSVVFVGTPLSVSHVEVERDGYKVTQRLFRFRVEESLRGGVKVGELEVQTGAGGGDCGYDFEPGTKYLVYGYDVEGAGRVGTGICSRTRPLAAAEEDVRYIRGVPGLPEGGEIFGTAKRYAVNHETGAWDEAGAVEGARVTAASGAQRLEAMTGGDGSYSLKGLSPGRYTVSVVLPANLSPREEETVEIHGRGCAQVDYRTVLDGRVAGKLADARGKSLGGVFVNLLPAGAKDAFRSLSGRTKEDGSFEFRELPPGRYLLGVNLGDAPDEEMPYRSTYYPSTTDRAAAKVFELGEGERLGGVEFRLPPPLAPRAVTGVVVWPDGSPVEGGSVNLTEVASGRPGAWGFKLDRQGRFSVPAYEGVPYKISASVPADPDWKPESGESVALLVSPEVEVTPSPDSAPVRLVINVEDDVVKRTRRGVRARPRPRRRD
ncbi:MAG TPA: hypothetical protein VM936_02550 [Pyrinomonadaceae bacterium]|nr:hypothetical protein [Pyrinomonadaceae bacterium]